MRLALGSCTAAVAAVAASLAVPATVLAHQLTERYQAPLPLLAYVAGAAIAVAMSFAFVTLRAPRPAGDRSTASRRARTVPRFVQVALRTLGLVAWLWIVAQAVVGGSGVADVASLFIWVYGWVGLALVSALAGPLWSWIDPFTTLHMLLGGAARRLGLGSDDEPAGRGRDDEAADRRANLARLDVWPAALGFTFVLWLELVARLEGGRSLGLVLVGYTLVTLAAMSYYGRDAWRRHGEVFSVWFGLLGRLAPLALDGTPEQGRLRRRPFGAGLRGGWSIAQLVLVTLGTGSIIYDGLSQTQLYFDLFGRQSLFGLPEVAAGTVVMAGFLALLVGLVLAVARHLGTAAVGAGLLPVAVGYLVAHYLVYLLVDGQRIVNAINDPLQRGDNLLGFDLGFREPELFLPTAIVWSIQLAAVVGGHVVGAWAGHAELERAPTSARPMRQLPLAVLMVLLTSVTLWSLGQNVITEPEAFAQPAAGAVMGGQ